MLQDSQHAASLVGTVLDGAYQLTRLIFEGGMGTVYEAVQLRLNKRVAVKVMVPDLADNPEALARFRRELEITSQLAHPHVITLIDYGLTPARQPYLVMEYLDGEDLQHRLERVSRLPLPIAADIVAQAARALAFIHGKGIVHRDLKPANIFLLPVDDGQDFVKVVDFGISKVRAANTKLTRAFTMVGTPECMSPEQATARVDDVDHRSDQWALACVAWRMLAGQMPFVGHSLEDLLRRVVNEEPPPLSAALPGCPPAIEAVLRRALAKRQADRFPTISAFARAFETAAREAAAPTPVRVRRAPTFVLGALTALGLAAAAAFAFGVPAGLTPSDRTIGVPADPAVLGAPVPTERPRPQTKSRRLKTNIASSNTATE